ncbi:UNVERIFIED_CONTAM: hypothetical protein FKN15_060977 [Acipenser sinensis]
MNLERNGAKKMAVRKHTLRAPYRASCLRSTATVLGKGSVGDLAVQRHYTGETAASGFISCRNAFSTSASKPPNTSLFVPGSIGAELTQPLDKSEVLKVLNRFYKRKEMQRLAAENGLDGEVLKVLNRFYKRKEMQRLAAENGLDARLFHQAFISFRKYVLESDALGADLHIILNDFCCGADVLIKGNCDREREDLSCKSPSRPKRALSRGTRLFKDGPAWREGRKRKSAILVQGGMTILGDKITVISCAALDNWQNVPCDLVTGEERTFVSPEGKQSSHVACTIEMCSVTTPWLCAEEIHVCGEAAAIDFVTELMYSTGEEVEIRNYKRLTPMSVLDRAVESLDNLHPGDCIVCFNKNDIYSISRQIEARGLERAVIYGSLPPGTKLAQAKKFNDPDDPCKILVATDAIGMGLNLSIKRIIFNSLVKPTVNEKGEKEMDTITTSQALQIAGRAGRFSSMFKEGAVTTMHRDDLPVLKEILSRTVNTIETAGLHPTADQIEMFAYHLPDATLSNLIDIFVSLSQVDGLYFVCNIDDFKFLADMIQHIPLNLRSRYVFCTAPINRKQPFVCTSFLKIGTRDINGYWFMDMFPDANLIRDIQKELDNIIQLGVRNITWLIRASETNSSSLTGTDAIPDDDIPLHRTFPKDRGLNTEDLSEARQQKQGQRRIRGSKMLGYRTLDSQSEQDGSLSSRLVQEGLLSTDLLEQLQREWAASQANGEDPWKETAGSGRKINLKGKKKNK